MMPTTWFEVDAAVGVNGPLRHVLEKAGELADAIARLPPLIRARVATSITIGRETVTIRGTRPGTETTKQVVSGAGVVPDLVQLRRDHSHLEVNRWDVDVLDSDHAKLGGTIDYEGLPGDVRAVLDQLPAVLDELEARRKGQSW